MRCEDIAQQLSEYVDGVLEPGQTERLESHLAECAACRNELEAVRQTVALLHDMEAIEPPSDLLTRVHAELETERVPTRNRGRQHGTTLWTLFSRPPMQLAIAASLLAVVSIHMLRNPRAVSPTADLAARQQASDDLEFPETATKSADKRVLQGSEGPDSVQPEMDVEFAEELADAVLDAPALVEVPAAERAVVAEVTVADEARERSVRVARARPVVQSKKRKGAAERNGAIWGGAVPERKSAIRRSPEASVAKLSAPAAPAPVLIEPEVPPADAAGSKDVERYPLIASKLDADDVAQRRALRADVVAEAESEDAIAESIETRRTEITLAAVDLSEILKHVNRLALSHHEGGVRAAKVSSFAAHDRQSDDVVGRSAVDREVIAPRVYHVEVAADKYAELMEGLQAFKDVPAEGRATVTSAPSARARDKASKAVAADVERPVAKQTLTLIITVVSR
jgi:hypothetical protein